jgi:hypothetical protein
MKRRRNMGRRINQINQGGRMDSTSRTFKSSRKCRRVNIDE